MPAWHALPRLLHSGAADGDDEYADGEHVDDTLGLRIAAIFIILFAGLLGGIPPLFIRGFRKPVSTVSRLVRSLAAGVIVALALVHIIPEAVEELDGLGGVEFPLGGTCVLFGIVIMILFEHIAHVMHHGGEQRQSHSSGALAVAEGGEEGRTSGKHALPAPADGAGRGCLSVGAADSEAGAGHTHVCVSHVSASNWVAASGEVEGTGGLRQRVVAYLFELGCIFHSFIIGLSLGVNQTDITEVRALLIALAFHQCLEGISLASVIVRGGFSVPKGAAMVAAYSLTCPVGIAVGIAIAESYDAESITARGVQGTFNGVSGGMLLYIALVQLTAEDISLLSPGRQEAWTRLWSFAALCAGAASMCLLAIWA